MFCFMGIRAKMHELVDQLSEDELEELHRNVKARHGILRLRGEQGPTDGRSFFEAARKYIGVGRSGVGDLATNPAHMEGFGE